MSDWIDLTKDWEIIRTFSEQRDKQKKKYKSGKNWSKYSTHFVGLCGEFVFSYETGEDVDLRLRAKGDLGYDFVIDGKTYSIKTSTYWKDPILKEYLHPKKWCDFYVLVGVDTTRQRGKIFGYCTKSEIQNAPLKDFGYGKQRAISHKELRGFNNEYGCLRHSARTN